MILCLRHRSVIVILVFACDVTNVCSISVERIFNILIYICIFSTFPQGTDSNKKRRREKSRNIKDRKKEDIQISRWVFFKDLILCVIKTNFVFPPSKSVWDSSSLLSRFCVDAIDIRRFKWHIEYLSSQGNDESIICYRYVALFFLFLFTVGSEQWINAANERMMPIHELLHG